MTVSLSTIVFPAKIPRLISLLGSDKDGEVLGAARALRRYRGKTAERCRMTEPRPQFMIAVVAEKYVVDPKRALRSALKSCVPMGCDAFR
jgi:hypothetical protein